MPIQTIRDPKTGEERRVYVAPAGMGEGAAPKPKAQPQPGGGFLGSLNDLNPMKQVSALGAGVSEFMRTGDINKGIAAASRGSAPATGLGRSVNRALLAGAQRAADDIRYEVNRAQMAQKQIAAGVSPYDVKVPSSGPGAPSAQNVRLPGIIDYDSLRVEPQNPVEDVAATIIEQVPFFVAGGPFGRAMMGLARGVPGISKAVAGFERMTGGLQAAGGAKKVAGIYAEEAVSGAVPSMVATYYTNQPKEGTLSDALSSSVKGTPLEAIVAKGLLTNPNDTVEQARIRAAFDDAIWSVPLGGTLGTGFRGVGAMKNATKRALVDAIHGTVKVAQADAATKDAVQAATSGAPAVAVAPGVPSAGTPAVRVISGKPTYSSQVYQGLRRQPLWEKTGVEIQGVLEPQAPQVRPAEAYTSQLNYSDVKPDAGPLNASGRRYAEALAGQDQIAIEATSQKLQASFNNAAARLGIELGPNAASKSWSMWDIGKQLYMDANPAKSNKPYVLGNPLTNLQVQSDIVDRMLGFEITKGVDVEGKRLKSWQLTDIGRKAREEAGVDLGLALDPDSQRVVPSPTAPATPEAAALQLQQARADLVAATQRLQSEAAKEVVTAPEPVAVPEGQLPGMNQPAYGQVATIETSSVAAAPRTFQYKAEGQTTTGRSGSLAEENVYDPRYGGVISVWRDTQGELGNPGQVYVVNGHNRLELANRSGFPVINVQFIDAPTAADARLTGALQNIKDDKGTGVDAAKIFRETGMTIEDLRLQNVTLSGKLASEGVAMARLPQWLFDKVATGGLPTAKAVALGSAEGLDSAVISDVAKQAIKGKWTAEKIVQAMQEAKFAGTSTAPGGVLPGFEEMFKASNVKALIDVRTAAFKQLSVEMRALTAAAQTKNTAYLEAAGNAIDVEGSQAARRSAQEAVAVFNRVAGYEGPVRSILNELADQVPEGKDSSKIAASLVQFNLQRLRDAISEEMNGPRLLQDEAVVRQLTEAGPALKSAGTKAKLSEQFRGQLVDLGQSLGELTRTIDQQTQAREQRLMERSADLEQRAADLGQEAQAALAGYADPLEAKNLADARTYLGLPATANVAQIARVAKQEGHDGIVFTGDFGLPSGKREIDLRALPEVKAPENAGNPAPIQAKPVEVAPVVDNETISTALERQALAEEAGDTQLAGELGTWLGRRGVAVQPMGDVAVAAIERPLVKPGAELSHGTSETARKSILAEGFRASEYERSGTVAGEGVYMTPSERYAGEYGSKRVGGALPEDAKILNWTGSDQTLASLADEIGIAGPRELNKSANEVELNQAQQQQLKQWALDNGYDGIQYRTNFTPGGKAQEVVIYNIDLANRIVGSKAAAAPTASITPDFSAELPNLEGWQSVETGAGRTIGEGYTGATRITEREASELNRIAYQVSGITDFGLSDRIKVVYTESQARAYGDMSLVGRTAEIAGYYAPGTRFGGDAANDQIRVAMMAYGATKSFTQMLSTTYHESFHRLQRWFLNDAEQGVLARSEKALRELAAKNAESFGLNDNAAKFRDGTVGLKETTAEAFAGFARGLSVPGKPMEGFAKIKQLIDETINWLLTGGQYKTWDDVFEKAQLGDIKDRGPLGSVDDGIQYAADPPDPAEFARRIDQNMQALESGDLTPEDVARMGASDVRRITSRSGQTQYVPQASDQLIASNRALGEMLTSRAQQTGIGSYSQPAIVKAALDQLDRDGWAVEPTVQRLEAARRGDPRSQDDLVALAANVIQRDYLAAQNGMTAVEWQNAVDEGDRAAAMQRLWAGLEDQHRLDTALMTATRKDGQRLSVMQIKYDFDPTHRQVPVGTMLYHGTTMESAQAIMEEGFKASGFRSNLLGTGVYFAETSMYAGAYGEVAAAGDLPGDVRILDLVSMDKRIADLVQELGLGRLDKFEDTLLLTDAQKSAVREWAVGQGYSGIRFSPDFELAGGFTAPEVVIFDANVANRVVGSQAAVEPEIPATTESMKTDIDAEIANPLNTILGKIDPDIRADIEQGVMSADAVDMTETLSQIMVAARTNPGMRAKFNSMVTKTDVGKLNQEMVVQMYRAALLWSAKTATKMLIGSTYRAITMPINQAITELGTAGIAKTMGDNKAAHQALRQARLDIGMYGQYVSNITNAWRLTGESWKAGESLGNLGVSSTDIPQKNLRLNEQMSMFEEDADPANTLDNPWWLDPETTNMGALATRGAWKALMASQRAAGTFDTFFSSLVGPSAEWSRLMGLELDKAESRGLTGDEAWKTATKIVDERIESQWVDVITNGKVIQNGALTGVHAKAAMDWINFTDPLDVQFEPRTYEYGIAKAKEEGLTDTAEINRRATEWMQEDVPGWAQAGLGASRATSGLVPRLIQQALRHTPALGLLYPFPTSPANIVKSAARATGVLAPFVDTFYKDVFSQDRNTRARAIGEIATAYLTLATGVLMVNSGWVEMTGPGSYDPQTRAKMQRLNRPSYSIRLRNPMTGQTTRWWDLQALDTVSNVFALIGQHVDINNSLTKEDQKVLTSNMILAAGDQMRIVGAAQFSKDMYKSIGEIFNLIGDLENKSFIPVEGQIDPFSSYVERRLAGFLPAIFNNTRKGVDPYQRAIEKSTLPAPFGFVHELGQRFANKIPGLSSTLPPVLHPLTGEPAVIDQVWGLNYMPADQPWLKGVVNAMSPLAFTPTREGTKDPVDVELARLSGRGTAFQIWNAGEFNVPNYKLTQVQLNKLAAITSQLVPPGRSGTLHQELTAMVAPQSSYWQLPPPSPSKATTSARAIRVNKQISYYKPFIKDQFLATEPNLARMIEENKSTQGRAMFQAEYGMTWSPTPGNR